ncbi:MAG TPA: hypothetical protein VGP72_09615 [Planctomycetota bacterium]|jgi:hypothetical protein
MRETILKPSHLSVFNFARAFGLMKTPTPEELLKTVEDLQKVQGDALIIGGLAVGHHGYERATHDVDILYPNNAEFPLLRALKKDFKIVLKASNGWHHLEHRRTKVRLELIPEGGLTTYGFIPGPHVVGGEKGIISLVGLAWLKLVSGRGKDLVDLVELAKVKPQKMAAVTEKLPPELREKYESLLVQARTEVKNDPGRIENAQRAPDNAEESPATYGARKRSARKRHKPVRKR